MSQGFFADAAVDRGRVRADCRAIQAEVVRLGWVHWLVRGAVVLVVAWLFWRLAQGIVRFGSGLSYERLGSPDTALVSALTRVNPYLWWVVVAILAIIVMAILRSVWGYGVQRERAAVVSTTTLRQLAPLLSRPAREVLAWVWRDRSQPLTQGDLRRALAELRGGRIGMMATAAEQAEILGFPAEPPHTLPENGMLAVAEGDDTATVALVTSASATAEPALEPGAAERG